MNIIFLPAMEPGNTVYGSVPDSIDGCPEAVIYNVKFPRLVWYNEEVCTEAIRQIKQFGKGPFVLVGFSKSGLGAWNIARRIPELISHTVIFDVPVSRSELPPWGTDPFYRNDEEWQRDLPLKNIKKFKDAVSSRHILIMISGATFHSEMEVLSSELKKTGVKHVFVPHPEMKHSWNSGWIEEFISITKQKMR